ncbi:MAG: hypothetical protein H7A23_05385 [Leptospiraceae bacterium]|nr:hypothetical protein [Leptospiraceae bacterium]MCP5493969.1 hypothetical protein [Leptospiraceae bacterium]
MSTFITTQIDIGKYYFKLQDMERSEFHFTKSLEIQENSESYFYLGLIASQKNKLSKALQYFYKSTECNHDYGNPCNEIGIILIKFGWIRDALYWLKKAVNSKYNDAPYISMYNLATIYKAWNRPERALQYIHKALQINPEFELAIQLRKELISQ